MDNECATGYMKLKTRIDNIFRVNAHKEAITYMRDDNTQLHYSFENILHTVQKWSKELFEYNLVAGDRVAIIAPIMPNTVIAGLTLAYANMTAVMLDATLPVEEINRLLEFSDVRGIFTTEEIYSKLSCCKETILAMDLMKSGESIAICQHSITNAVKHATVDPDKDVMVIIFSSGTTSTMKGVMLTYDSILSSREKFVEFSGITARMNCLIVLPFNHISGYSSSMIYLLTGCGLGLIENLNSSKLQKGLLEYNPYCFGMVPKVYDIMADKIRDKIHEQGKLVECFMNVLFSVARFCRKKFGLKIGKVILKPVYKKVFGKNIYGLAILGTVCKPETAELFLDFGLEWANLYATTETNAPITSTGIYDRYPTNSVGMVTRFPDIEVKLSNPNENGIGEILVKSSQMMKGYFREPELTENAFEDGYFKTGDLGYINQNNYLYIVGRSKDVIVLHNGKKVSAADIDEYYKSQCKNINIASCGVTNKDGYDEVHLFIETDGLSEEEIADVSNVVRERATRGDLLYKIEQIHMIEKIPVTSVGKVKRYLLKAQAEQDTVVIDAAITRSKENEEFSKSDKVIQIIKSLRSVSEPMVEQNAKLEELGFDSLALFELCTEIDKATGINLSDKISGRLTVKEVIEYLDSTKTSSTDVVVQDYPMEKTSKHLKRIKQFGKFANRLWNIEVVGVENVKESKVILCPNHESYLDALWIASVLQRKSVDIKAFHCLAAEHLMKKRIMKKTLYALGGISVDRSGNTAPAMQVASKCLGKERCVMLIHPEGTRSRTGELGEFKLGAARLSLDSGVKIVPVCINGAYEIFPPHRKLPRVFNLKKFKRYPLSISFGQPISPEGKTDVEITEEIRRQIVEMKEQ